jgi:hypothetical protein
MLPSINYGHGGANQIGDRLVHPGTYGIRQSTLRSLWRMLADNSHRTASNMDFRAERPRRSRPQHRDQRGV